MNLNTLRYFITAAEGKSITNAAKTHFISQSALSQQIKRMEEELGAKLINKNHSDGFLTEEGELALQESKRIVQIYDQLRSRVHAMANPEERVIKFGISPFYSHHHLPVLLPPMIRAYPFLQYEVMEDYTHILEKALMEGTLDFALLPSEPENPALRYMTLYQESILLAVPKDSLLNNYVIPSADFPCMDLWEARNEPFISVKPVQKFYDFGIRLCEDAGFTPNVVCKTMNWDTLNFLVSTGMGVGFVPDIVVDQLEESIRPNYYRPTTDYRRNYSIAVRKGERIPEPVHMMIDSFQKTFYAKRKQSF